MGLYSLWLELGPLCCRSRLGGEPVWQYGWEVSLLPISFMLDSFLSCLVYRLDLRCDDEQLTGSQSTNKAIKNEDALEKRKKIKARPKKRAKFWDAL